MRVYSHAYVIWTRRHIQVNVNVEKYVTKQVQTSILGDIKWICSSMLKLIVCYLDESRARFIHPDGWVKLLWAKMPLSLILVYQTISTSLV